MQHYVNAGGETAMHIDHFNPTLPSHLRNRYENLFLATGHCNIHKRDFWPSKKEQSEGIRFLNPCEEQDYGTHIFEDPVTFELWGDTVAGRYHIRMLKLNAPHLVRERKMRHAYRKLTDANGRFEFVGKHGDIPAARNGWKYAIDYVDKTIPPIPQRPKPSD